MRPGCRIAPGFDQAGHRGEGQHRSDDRKRYGGADFRHPGIEPVAQCRISFQPMNARISARPANRYTIRSSRPVTRKNSARRPSRRMRWPPRRCRAGLVTPKTAGIESSANNEQDVRAADDDEHDEQRRDHPPPAGAGYQPAVGVGIADRQGPACLLPSWGRVCDGLRARARCHSDGASRDISTSTRHTRPPALLPEGPACRSCCGPPLRRCGGCGLDRPVRLRPAGGQPDLCERCAARPLATCAACGQQGRCDTRDGPPVCMICRTWPAHACRSCGHARPVMAWWPMGPVCGACCRQIRSSPAHCPRCGQHQVLLAPAPMAAGPAGRAPATRASSPAPTAAAPRSPPGGGPAPGAR